ncbi:hypothetical protein BDA99DRAFT_535307 [Phascolomyces articulosus]|uniref:Uncharacterized protein n=1 Tax=Phascolomyces articulosus TaxID=60185 RepID=A0AAD5K4Z5_9FUNG|nr:hypothetical protein BDA99DRAFT_535307 [Phascolomyces articulosus]
MSFNVLFEVPLSFIRLFLYFIVFFYKKEQLQQPSSIKSVIVNYYYIWLPAVAAWIHECLRFYHYFYLSVDNDNMIVYNTELLVIQSILTWYAIILYWLRLDVDDNDNKDDNTNTTSFLFRIKHVLHFVYETEKPIKYGLFVYIAYTFFLTRSDLLDGTFEDPLPYKFIDTLSCFLTTLFFLISIRGHPSSPFSSPLFTINRITVWLMFGLITLQPIYTPLEAVIRLLHNEQMYSQYSSLGPLLKVISFLVAWNDGKYLSVLLSDVKHGKLFWPSFKNKWMHQNVESKNNSIASTTSSYHDGGIEKK